jgi:hypothetical protein
MTSDKKKIDSNHCRYCGLNYSEELIKKIKQNEVPLFCEFCGERIMEETISNASELVESKNNDESSRKSEEKNISESSTLNDNIIEQLKLFISRRIYELFKNPKYSVKLDKKSNELAMDQLNDMSKVLRTMLICQPIPEYWFNELHNVNLYDFMKCYEKFQESAKDKKIFRKDYLEFFRETIQFVYGLKRGTIRASDLQGFQGKILKDLKKCYGFIRNATVKGGFEWYLTIFLAGEIYNAIQSPKFSSKLTKDQGGLKNSFANRLALIAMKSLESNQARKNWISRFKWSSKVKYLKKLETFLFELKSDHIYRQSFLEFLHWLIKTVFALVNGKYDFANLRGIKKSIAEHLISKNPFSIDPKLSSIFKSNLVIVLSRLIYANIRYQEIIQNLKVSQMELTKSFIDKLIDFLIAIIMSGNRIKSELLNNLNEISEKDFNIEYKKFQINLRSDQIYCRRFREFLYELMKIVFRLISEKYDISELSKIECVIIKDLKNCSFNEDFFKKIIKNRDTNREIKALNDNKNQIQYKNIK